MKKNVDGINDEYEVSSDMPNPLLDFDDSENEEPDAPDEDAFELMGDTLDVFEKKHTDDTPFEDAVDFTEKKYDVFALAESKDEPDEDAFDISEKSDSEPFPLKSGIERDTPRGNEAGNFIPSKSPVKSKKKIRGGVILSMILCAVLIVFLIWTLVGTVYTNKYNAYIYNEFLHGADVEYINPDFLFFITLDGNTLPVVKSDKPMYYKSFNGNFFAPGTLTSKDGCAVTGSPKLLPSINSSLVGKTLITEKHGERIEYEIYSAGTYNPEYTYDGITVFVTDKASKTGYTAIFTKQK